MRRWNTPIDRLVVLPVCARYIVVRLVTFRLFDELDDLLGVV